MLGIFDSGSGGLTVLNAIKKRAPYADIVYFGDIKNAPYGNRSLEELGALTVLGFERLLQSGATHIISACNSVSAHIALPLFRHEGVPEENLIDMVQPTVKAHAKKHEKKVLVVGTVATIKSGIYEKGFTEEGIPSTGLSIGELAGAIERGEPDEYLYKIIKEALAPVDTDSFSSIVLACTHFPLVRHLFVRALVSRDGSPEPIDPAHFVAEEVVNRFPTAGSGKLHFIISADSDHFRRRIEQMFANSDCTLNVVE